MVNKGTNDCTSGTNNGFSKANCGTWSYALDNHPGLTFDQMWGVCCDKEGGYDDCGDTCCDWKLRAKCYQMTSDAGQNIAYGIKCDKRAGSEPHCPKAP